MPSNHFILCDPLILPPSISPSTGVFSNESVLHIRWPKYWSFSFSISPSNECSRLISFRMDWLDLLTVQGTLKSLLQYHGSKASILWLSALQSNSHIHRVGDAIQPSHLWSSPSPPALNPSQHQSLFQLVNSSHEVAKVLEFQLQHHSFQRNPRVDLLQNRLVGSLVLSNSCYENSVFQKVILLSLSLWKIECFISFS